MTDRNITAYHINIFNQTFFAYFSLKVFFFDFVKIAKVCKKKGSGWW